VLKDVEVVRHAIVLHQTAPFSLVLGHNTIGVIERSLGEWFGLAPSHVPSTLGVENMGGNPKSNATVDTASTTEVVFAVLMKHVNLVAQEPGAIVVSMSDQGLLLVELHMQSLVEKGAQLLLDRLGFTLRAG
jgi:hypothetical protein